ncbi:MAG: HupE/UreJ family protein [Gemmatimonadaceae bacterium]|jgi:hypothetical protein|nr:HupE/UreJ family protein [Gemmatimonadaceae bacterium]
MLDTFLLYLRLGLGHITDLAGYDHILFVLALCATYQPAHWRRVALLVTAFTVGHTITLALATLGAVTVRSAQVEFLIPVTIVATAVGNIVALRGDEGGRDAHPRVSVTRYAITVAFGCIHGLGFSSYLRALLGAEESLAVPLLAFNVGLEIGQLAIVTIGLLVGWLCTRIPGVTARRWALALSVSIGALGSWLAWQRSIL